MNLAKAHSKARNAMKRREEDIETEELEGGEINLIPYLDIVTNLMLFILASISSGLILGQINTMLPDQGGSAASMANDDPKKPPDEKPLKLVVSVGASPDADLANGGITVWSISGLEGTLQEPKAQVAQLPYAAPPKGEEDLAPIPVFDYGALNDALVEIASRRWNGTERKLKTYEAILMASPDIPYGTIIRVMDSMRCKRPPSDKPGRPCALPRKAVDENGEDLAAENFPAGEGRDGQPCAVGGFCAEGLGCEQDVDEQNKPTGKSVCHKYNADKQALFHNILFSTGFE